MTKNPNWFNMEEAIKTEDRSYWPYFFLGINRIEAARGKEGNTEELTELEREWKTRWEKEADASL